LFVKKKVPALKDPVLEVIVYILKLFVMIRTHALLTIVTRRLVANIIPAPAMIIMPAQMIHATHILDVHM
jgi:hypothetical protein